MPNRILKESIRTSDSINSLSLFEEVLFYRLIVSCDDYGRFDGRPAIIKGSCFPLKETRVRDIEAALEALSAAGLLACYTVEGRPYLQLTTWEKHQQIRAKKSKYPSLDTADMKPIADDIRCNHVTADVPVIQSNPTPNTDTKTMCMAEASALFERLWALYPRKKGKGKVSDSQKLKLLKTGYEEMERAIRRYNKYVESVDYLDYQNGSTFFNKGYIDYLDANYEPSRQKQASPQTSQFNRFMHTEYDFDALENEAMGK